MTVEVEIDIGNAAQWVLQHKERSKASRDRVRADILPETLAEIKAEAEKRRASPEMIAQKLWDEEWRRREVRDGLPVRDDAIRDFYAKSRSEGAFQVAWGDDPGSSGERSRLLIRANGEPAWTATINLRIAECWVARSSGDCVARVQIPEQGEREGKDRRSLLIVFSSSGAIREHFQMREQADRFLGIDEAGANYVWSRGGRTSLSALGTHEEWYRWRTDGPGYVNSGSFESGSKRIRLHSDGGTVLELCWEDEIAQPMEELQQKFHKADHPSERLRVLQSEWEMVAVGIQREAKAGEFLSLVDSISVDELRLHSWYGLGPLDLLRLRVDVLANLKDPQAASEARETLRAWETAILFPQSAVADVKAALEAGDSVKLQEIESRINECLANHLLQNDPQMLARVWRAFGHLDEGRGNLSNALDHFNKAVGLWDQVGCFRDAQRLAKRIERS